MNLSLLLAGMIALSPTADGGSVTVLLVRAIGPNEASDKHLIPNHEAFVVACGGEITTSQDGLNDWDEVKDRLKLKNCGCERYKGNNVVAFKLYRDEITMTFEGKPPSGLDLNRSPDCGSYPDRSHPETDMCWLPQMKVIAPLSKELDPVARESVPAPDVLARLSLTAGKFETAHLAAIEDQTQVCTFKPVRQAKPTPNAREQVVADEVKVLLSAPDAKSLTLTARHFNSSYQRSMTIKGGDVEVCLANLMLPGGMHDEKNATHGELYYRLARNVPDDNARPVASAVRGVKTTKQVDRVAYEYKGSAHRPICMMVEY